MYFYRAYGYFLDSSIFFPTIPVAKDSFPADISIHLGDVDCPVDTFPGMTPCLWRGDQDARFFVPSVGCFHIRNGNEIVVSPAPDVGIRVLQSWIFGTALGLLFYQRGILALHGSVATRGNGALLILGAKGWGKSTLTSALCQEGFDFLADDLAVIRRQEDIPFIMPGPPETKLWPDSLTALKKDSTAFEKVHPNFEKRVLPAQEHMAQPCELKRIYILDRGDKDEILPLTPKEAFTEIIRHSYRIDWVSETMAQKNFSQWADLVRQIPVMRFRRRFALESLHDQARKIRDDYDLAQASGSVSVKPIS